MRRIATLMALVLLASCTDFLKEQHNTILHFSPYVQEPFTKAAPGEVFSKLNVMMFDSAGEKVFDKVKTQQSDEEGFGTLAITLPEGIYTVVAVGHSSKVSATIKSPEAVQFTAKDGEKLTDTFNYCGKIEVTEEKKTHELKMTRVAAMFRLVLTDKEMPVALAKMKLEYTGGSANYNPSTGQGITKSSQSETRARSEDGIYEVYTFPYLASSGVLTIKASALDGDGNILVSHTFKDVPIKVNTITSYKGAFFGDMPGSGSQTAGTFTVDPKWSETNEYTY